MSAAPPKSLPYSGIGIRIGPYRKYGNTSANGTWCHVLAGGFRIRYARDRRPLAAVALAEISSHSGDAAFSLHTPLRGTPRCAPWPRGLRTDTLPHSRSGAPSVRVRTQRGFTLLELIVVLFLAGLVAALVAPSFSGTLESSRLRSGAAEVRATFTLARTLAASGSRLRTVAFDVERGQYVVEGEARTYVLPEGVRIESAHVGTAAVEQETFRVRFFPDGSAEEAEIVVASSAGGRLRVTVDPLTGIAEAGI